MAQTLSNLPIGAKIKYGKHSVNGETAQPIIWLVVNKSTNVTLLTEKVIDFRCFDAKEPNSTVTSSVTNGFGRYSDSNLGQWLNSVANAGAWYTPQHDYDQAPIYALAGNNTEYLQRPGFLYHFTDVERNAILITTVLTSRSWNTPDPNDPINQRVFIPSTEEITTDWAYFNSGGTPRCSATDQAVNNSLVSPRQVSSYISWWTRNTTDNVNYMRIVDGNGMISHWENWNNSSNTEPYRGWLGVRPAINLASSLLISDTTDSDGCYTAIWNTAPSAPSILNIPTIYGGRANSISWSTANDPDGDSIKYTLECSVDSAAYSVLFIGDSTVCAHMLPFGKTTVQYRVKATDPSNASSAYTTSPVINVINNHYPEISDSDANLGVKKAGFAVSYQITDADHDRVIVTEAIDGVPIQVKEVQLGVMNTLSVKDNTWLVLPNGSHTITISASDGIDTSVRTYTFTKLVDQFIITNSPAWDSTTMPTRIMLVVTRNIPRDATFKVEVCNNFYDPVPIWDDATDAVKSGLVHVFSNKTSTVNKWAVKFKITVNRNGASGACYVSAIGGNFE